MKTLNFSCTAAPSRIMQIPQTTGTSEVTKAESPQVPEQPEVSKMIKLEVLKLDEAEQFGRVEAKTKDLRITVPHQKVALHQVLYVPVQCPDTSDNPLVCAGE